MTDHGCAYQENSSYVEATASQQSQAGEGRKAGWTERGIKDRTQAGGGGSRKGGRGGRKIPREGSGRGRKERGEGERVGEEGDGGGGEGGERRERAREGEGRERGLPPTPPCIADTRASFAQTLRVLSDCPAAINNQI